jgi:hypothetical protein
MLEPKEIQDTDGVENPRMTGDSADQLFDDDTMEDTAGDGAQERRGSGGLGGGATQISSAETTLRS